MIYFLIIAVFLFFGFLLEIKDPTKENNTDNGGYSDYELHDR
jgi:hypothetical protein